MPAPPVARIVSPASSHKQVEGTAQKPLTVIRRPLRRLPPRPVVTPPYEEEQTLKTLADKIPQIIADFVRTHLGHPGAPTEIRSLLQALDTWIVRPEFVRRVALPDPITFIRLMEMTKPDLQGKEFNAGDLGRWLATLLLSLDRSRSAWDWVIQEAERLVLPPPLPAIPVGADTDESEKPHLRRLADFAKKMRPRV